MINGAAATGKTTLAKELAKRLDFQHIDLDDYYWEVPLTKSPTRDEIRERVLADIAKHPHFTMSGTIGSILWDLVNPLFDIAVLLFVPLEIRLERIHIRGLAKYGERILEGGDMYEKHQKFLIADSINYETGVHPAVPVTLERHERWATELLCPVLRLDGTKPIHENVELLAKNI